MVMVMRIYRPAGGKSRLFKRFRNYLITRAYSFWNCVQDFGNILRKRW